MPLSRQQAPRRRTLRHGEPLFDVHKPQRKTGRSCEKLLARHAGREAQRRHSVSAVRRRRLRRVPLCTAALRPLHAHQSRPLAARTERRRQWEPCAPSRQMASTGAPRRRQVAPVMECSAAPLAGKLSVGVSARRVLLHRRARQYRMALVWHERWRLGRADRLWSVAAPKRLFGSSRMHLAAPARLLSARAAPLSWALVHPRQRPRWSVEYTPCRTVRHLVHPRRIVLLGLTWRAR